jgi:hypothetical protein
MGRKSASGSESGMNNPDHIFLNVTFYDFLNVPLKSNKQKNKIIFVGILKVTDNRTGYGA